MRNSASVRISCLAGIALLAVAWAIHAFPPVNKGIWTTSNFLDFIEGTLVDGGVNTYIASDGSVRLINLWDLNKDGNIDVVFPNTHDNNEKVDLFIYWAKGGFTPDRRTQLPTDGGKAAAIADLNGDGYPDLIVANSFNGTRTELDSYVYWGNAKGFDANHRSKLPTRGAEAVAVADLNRDGSADIVFANSGLTYHVTKDHFNQSYIYWGAKGTYSVERRSVLKTVNARDVKIADLNQDGFPDIVFANEGNTEAESGAIVYWGNSSEEYAELRSTRLPGERSSAVAVADLNNDGVLEIILANAFRLRKRELGIYNIIETVAINSYIYWGSSAGYSVERRIELPTVGASAVAAADLNRDGRPDVVFANSTGGAAYIYWSGSDGFRPHRRTALRTLNASDVAVEDLNGDGHQDLIFAHESDGRSHNTVSYIYWGGREGFTTARRTELPTWGATGIVVADLNGDRQKDLVFINKQDGTATDTWIYWGDQRGHFSPHLRQALPGQDPYSYSAADINNDGHVDILLPGSRAGSQDIEGGSKLYWGSAEGYSLANKTLVSSRAAFSGRVADFNRDGYLDLSLSEWAPDDDETGLYWGGPNGFSAANRFVFRIGAIRFHTLADLDRDGWLDIILPTTDNRLVIYWNDPGGFDNGRKTVLPCASAVSVEVADLDSNGYLDIIVANLFDMKSAPDKPRSFGGTAEAGTLIFWGSAQGYSKSRRLVLPSVGNEDVAVADLNGDGLLDLVLTSYHAGYTRSHHSYIYWNTPQGFGAERVTMLPTNSASGVMVADFNRDGYKDILFACHSKDGNHRNDSFLYWGSPAGYSTERRSLLPGLGPHLMTVTDIGNIYNRNDRYDYISTAFDAGLEAPFERLTWKAETPFRTRVEFQIRTAGTREDLASVAWRGPKGPNSFYRTSPSKLLRMPREGRWIQYKATLISPDSANSPVLHSVSVEYRR